MSIRVMHWVWEHATDVQGSDLLVLLALADWANDDGLCWPSVPRIAAKARVSVRTTQYTIGRLVARGYVRVEPGGGRRHPNRYTVQMPRRVPPGTTHPLHPSRGATDTGNGATAHGNGAPAPAPEPLPDPSTEPSGVMVGGSGFRAQRVQTQPRTLNPASAAPTPAEATWHAINDALDHWAPGAEPPSLSPDARAVIAALGGFAALAIHRPRWPAVLSVYNRLRRDGTPTGGTGP